MAMPRNDPGGEPQRRFHYRWNAAKTYAKVPTDLGSKNFYEAVEDFEQTFLQGKYSFYEGNVSKMAAALEMDRSYLHGKLKNFGIHSARKPN